MEKESIRKSHLDKRRALSKKEFDSLANQIVRKTIDFLKEVEPNCIHCFLPIDSKNEIDTQPIIDYCWGQNIKVVIPVSDFKNVEMRSAEFTKDTKIAIKQYGIPEPLNPIWTENNEIDLIITPLLAFDSKGFRVGYGKGFYDKFFASINSATKKLGLSLFEPISFIQDINKFDLPLDSCITPNMIYHF